MGRGRQKAKHTKLARELKYSEIETDYNKLQQELAGTPTLKPETSTDEEYDEYSEIAKKYGVNEDEEEN
ncbi:MAG: DUF3073 domain-containing protein [Micrococcaceae bacterium]